MREFTSVWGQHLKDFFEYKNLCGYKYDKGVDVLFQFDIYYKNLDINELKLTRDIIEPFLYLKDGGRISTLCWKASIIRQFGEYVVRNNILDKVYKIPTIYKKGETEFIPYILSKQEIIDIIAYISNYIAVIPKGGIEPYCNTVNATSTVFKVLISTGMRIGEVLNLRLKNVDFDNDLFVVLEAKNDNQRLVPFSKTLKEELLNYIGRTPFKIKNDDHLFKIAIDRNVNTCLCSRYLRKALDFLDNKYKFTKKPRIHDFRHTYAVMALTQLQQTEGNVNLSLTYLSDYLGHKSLKETQKYLWLTPSLFEETKNQMNSYTSFIKEIYDREKYDD